MGKPFAMRELLARVSALTRWAPPDRATTLQIADLTMNMVTWEVKRGAMSFTCQCGSSPCWSAC